MNDMPSKCCSYDELLLKVRKWQADGEKVVFTNGCFDILHAGHVRYLAAARQLGDRLVIGLNSDASVRRLKGPKRPVAPEDDRAEVLSALGAVDAVTLFDDDTPEALIGMLLPDILVKGDADRSRRSLVRKLSSRTTAPQNVQKLSDFALVRKSA